MTAKADIIKYLKDSFAFGHKAVATLSASNLVQPITRNNKPPLLVCSWPPLPQPTRSITTARS
jgi:hypothetical protein